MLKADLDQSELLDGADVIVDAILGTGAYLAISKDITPGLMIAASIMMGRGLAPVEQAVGQWKRIASCRAAWTRLDELFRALPAEASPTALPQPTGQIEVEGVTVWPATASRPAVKNVSFTLAAGESLAIVGASASGKSSLARGLAGVWPLRGGNVRLDGAAFNQFDPVLLGKSIGYLPQDVELFAGTVAENIARLGLVDDGKVIEAAKAAGVHETILRLPNGYDTLIGEGGMSRVYLASRERDDEPLVAKILRSEVTSASDSWGSKDLPQFSQVDMEL